MKLLYCQECGDIFNLKYVEKTCGCGKTRGMYVDSRKAVAEGPAVAIGMGSGSLAQATEQAQVYDAMDRPFNRKKFQNDCQVLTWVRPLTGPGNPNTLDWKTWQKRNHSQTMTLVEFSQREHKKNKGD